MSFIDGFEKKAKDTAEYAHERRFPGRRPRQSPMNRPDLSDEGKRPIRKGQGPVWQEKKGMSFIDGFEKAAKETSTSDKVKRVGAGALVGGVLGGAAGSASGAMAGALGETVRTSPSTHRLIAKAIPSSEAKKMMKQIAKSRNIPREAMRGAAHGGIYGGLLGAAGLGTAAYMANRKKNPVGPRETGE